MNLHREPKRLLSRIGTIAVVFGVVSGVAVAVAQQPVVTPAPATPEQAKAMMEAQRRAGRQGGQPPGQPGQPGQPQEAKPEEKKGDDAAKKKEAESTVKRPEKPPVPPDPRDLKVKLDDKGRVPPFNFIGQPWPDVLQWLANISKCSLDWQELPNDYLNLTTQRSYTVDEVRDLINRHLNARGYISIQSGEVLSVFKVDKVDPSLIHQAKEEDLYNLKPYDYVKISFDLPASMEVDKAKDDVKQVLSPNAKIIPLVTSKRLLIMDSVANLRGVSEMLNMERMVQSGKIVPKEFVLKYARPQQVIEILYMMVGADPKGKPQQTDPQQQQQMQQMMQQMQQQGRGAEAAKMMANKDAPKVYLAYNRMRNSVLVNAPPEQLKIIEQTINYLDVPFGVAGGATSDVASPGGNERTFRKYSLVTLDPDKFVQTLEQIGGLSPYAELKADDDSKMLFAMASEADHKKIATMVRDFDGSGRKFEVIWLRRLPADAVAATIYKMMAGQNEKKDDNRRRYYFYDWYDNDREKKKDTIQGFGVEADIENNRLLIWATDVEMERVRELLVKLGEIPGAQQDARPVRVIEPGDTKSTAELLKRLQDAWSASGGNDLIIKNPPQPKPVPEENDKSNADESKDDKPAKAGADRSASASQRARIAAQFVQLGAPAADPAKQEQAKSAANAPDATKSGDQSTPSAPATKPPDTSAPNASQPATPPPITITVMPDGRLMIASPDTAALDRLGQLIEQISPQQKRFKVYPLKHISALEMWLDLTDYFKEDMEAKEKGNDFMDWYWGPRRGGGDDKSSSPALSKRRKLMITYDSPSNSILVANASASQLVEIEQLIATFDKQPRSDSIEKRATRLIKVQYSRPSIIAAAIKEVYRDLLSTRDKEFSQGEQKDNKRPSAERVTIIDYGGSSSGDSEGRSSIKVGFEGALSLGADDVSGVLIVCAQQSIITDIERMVKALDDQSAPQTTVQVHRINGAIAAEALQKTLEKTVGKTWIGNRPEQQQPIQSGPADAEKQRGDQERGRNRNEKAQQGEKK